MGTKPLFSNILGEDSELLSDEIAGFVFVFGQAGEEAQAVFYYFILLVEVQNGLSRVAEKLKDPVVEVEVSAVRRKFFEPGQSRASADSPDVFRIGSLFLVFLGEELFEDHPADLKRADVVCGIGRFAVLDPISLLSDDEFFNEGDNDSGCAVLSVALFLNSFFESFEEIFMFFGQLVFCFFVYFSFDHVVLDDFEQQREPAVHWLQHLVSVLLDISSLDIWGPLCEVAGWFGGFASRSRM